MQATVPVLLHINVVGSFCLKLSSARRLCSHKICFAQCVHEMYSASHDDNVTMACCFKLHEIGESLREIMKPEMDLKCSPITQHCETHGCGKSSSISATEVRELSRK